MQAKYYSELMTCKNIATGKVTYYVSKCDIFQRVGKADYDKRYSDADGLSCMYTKTTKKYVRNYHTCTYY